MNIRLRLFLLLLGALLVAATFSFPLWSPLLDVETVEEVFPGLPQELQPTFAALPEAQQALYMNMRATDPAMAQAMVVAALQPDVAVPTEVQGMPTMEAPVVVGRGSFISIDTIYWAEGNFVIYQQPDYNRVLRFEEFRGARGPNLHVILSVVELPAQEDDRAEMLTEMLAEPLELDDFDIDLGVLQGTIGSQNYTIPPQVNLDLYNSIVIYCLTYQIMFSIAPIG